MKTVLDLCSKLISVTVINTNRTYKRYKNFDILLYFIVIILNNTSFFTIIKVNCKKITL